MTVKLVMSTNLFDNLCTFLHFHVDCNTLYISNSTMKHQQHAIKSSLKQKVFFVYPPHNNWQYQCQHFCDIGWEVMSIKPAMNEPISAIHKRFHL